MDPQLAWRHVDADAMSAAAGISALLDRVGLRGPKLATCKGDEENLARQLVSELKLTLEDWHLDYVASLVEAACKMEDLEKRLEGNASSASIQRAKDAMDGQQKEKEPMGGDMGLPRPMKMSVPKKGKKQKVVKLGPGGNRVVAGTKLLKLVLNELEDYGAPVLEEIEKISNAERAKEALLGRYRESTVRRYLGYWQGFKRWVKWSTGRGVPSIPTELVDYLYAREEEGLGPSVPLAISKAVAWFENLAGIESDQRSMNNSLTNLVVQELMKKLEEGAPPTKRAPRVLSAFIPALEEMVMDEEAPEMLRVAAWIKLLKVWASLRFDDVVHLKLSTFRWYDGQLSATLLRTKSTGAGKRVRHLPMFVGRHCWTKKFGWLETGYNLVREMPPRGRDNLVLAGLRSGAMREGVELGYAEMVAVSTEVMSRLRGIDGERLIPDGWERFWTEHSERATMSSGLAALGVPKDERDMLGRWKPEGSDQYVRTYNMAVSKMQQKMAEVIKFGDPYEELDEGAVLAELVEYLVDGWGTDRAETTAAVEAWKAAVGAKAGRGLHSRAQPKRAEAEETERGGSPSGSEPTDLDIAMVELSEKRKMRKLERDRDSGFIIVYNRLNRGMLHKSGLGGCWMARRREFRRCEFYDVEPPEEEYTSRCKLCWAARSKEGSETESTSDTEDELDIDSAKGSEGFRGSTSEVDSALEGFSPRGFQQSPSGWSLV